MNQTQISLIILDGFGLGKTGKSNAIDQANTPTFDKLFQKKYSKLGAHGEYVGLTPGQIGNSEVGHITIGTGRTIKQTKVKLDELYENNTFQENPSYKKVLQHCEQNQSTLHLCILLSSGGVHSYQNHLRETIQIIPTHIPISLHLFGDGRDVGPTSLQDDINVFLEFLHTQKHPNICISSLSGRYYSMDRDNNWDRISKAYQALTGTGTTTNQGVSEYIKQSYKKRQYDEFITPTYFQNTKPIKDNDGVILLNFRSDRARQITQAFVADHFEGFQRQRIKNLCYVSITQAYPEYSQNIILPNENIINTLGEVLANNKKTQFHIAETEKYAHVTKFFNGGRQITFTGEKDILIPSHKVPTYDLDPNMSAKEIYTAYKKNAPKYDFSIVNYANPDMVGHTGKIPAAIQCIETLDEIIKQTLQLSEEKGFTILLTADHGNCEYMGTPEKPHTAHTTNKVPFWVIKDGKVIENISDTGGLADIAPTVLDILGITKPTEMTGKSILRKHGKSPSGE